MAFEPAPLLIGLREGLEALLVLGIVLGMLDRLGARDRRPLVWAGFGAGIIASLGLGILVDRYFATAFEQEGGAAVFEIVVALAAVGVLTYMVLWMQRNARAMTEGIKERVARAVEGRQVWVLAFLGFVTVVREGVEVVLFYGALSSTIAWADIILWGSVGFAASAAIAFAIFRLTVQVDVRKFFAVTGLLLIFIAAGLLVHVVHAASDLGWIGHAEPLWDTSGTMPDEDHWLGGPLHALVGYEDQPTLLQLVLYTTYLVGVGGWYLANLRPQERRDRSVATAGVALLVLLGAFAVAGAVPAGTGAAGHDEHGFSDLNLDGGLAPQDLDHKLITADARALLEQDPDAKVGLLVRSHGEPQHYNASTYESFKQFVRGIWPYTGLPEALLDVDHGTYYMDEKNPWSDQVHDDREPVDAWLEPATLPAVPVGEPAGLSEADQMFTEGTLYHTPGAGPGLGEGDLFEIIGLGAYETWLKMDNFSPMFQQNVDHADWLGKHLQNHFGDRVKMVYVHHIDPKMGDRWNLGHAVQELVDWGPTVVLDAYHSSIHSDVMNTCMMQPRARAALDAAGYSGPVVDVGMAGTHPAWGAAVAGYIAAEADHFEADESVSIYLAQHGASPETENPCGSGNDQYMTNTQAQFEVANAVLQGKFGDRFTIRHVYGQGAHGDADPDDRFLSPLEAVDLDREAGIGHAVVIPYEFWGDAMDNLVVLRESLGFEPHEAPYYDSDHETHTTVDGVHVDVWSAHYGVEGKGTAFLARVSDAMAAALGGTEEGADA